MQNHTAALTRSLDRIGVRQLVLTSRLGGPTGRATLAPAATVWRLGAPLRRMRQMWAAAATRHLAFDRLGPFDLVHAHQGEDIVLLPLAMAAVRRFRCPLVVTVHCSVRHTVQAVTPHKALIKAVGGPVEGWGLRRADRVITLTRSTADRLVGDGVDATRISVIPSGFEAPLFDATAAAGPTGSAALADLSGLTRPRVGYVGRLAPQKDVVSLVRAFPRLATPGASLVIVGDGPDRPLVERAVADTGAADRVRLTGFVPHDRVPDVLAALDVLVLPSRYEELGSVLVEGLRAGLPIVATAVGGIPEVVRHGVTGLLVPPGDPPALATAIDRVLTEPGLAATLAAGAQEAARAYGWDELARSVLSVYRSTQLRRGPAPVR
jgi:2-deoxystreptamine N-acetyl-D-glucosaminyltransferase/2-deoxystreptamine glucosyltransferase